VAVSRLYRGEHHPLDVVGGALLGVGALAIALLATRAAVVADERRRPLPDDGAR
jgi:membrane-associated phospholipid phosphatase